ncbi:hypothetical protein JCM11641_007672 [Rhodosporidiobolus odoratus]
MSRRARPFSLSANSPASKRLARIDNAFNSAVGYGDVGLNQADTSRMSAKTKGKRKAVVPDDEEDAAEDDEMEMVASTAQPSTLGMEVDAQPLGGGFLPEDQGAGGFLPELDSSTGGNFLAETDTTSGGGFFPSEPLDAGGFLPLPLPDEQAGGFLPDEQAGGCLPDLSDSTMHDSPSFATARGFLSCALPGDAFAFSGGFLPDELPTPAPLTNADKLPTPPPLLPPPDRIPLSSVPSALRQLGLHKAGLPAVELLELFEDVASDDEEMGGKSVRRERFREACEVLMQESDDEGDEGEGEDEVAEGGEYRDEVEDQEEQPAGRRRRPTRTTRSTAAAAAARSTRRSGPVVDDDENGEEGLDDQDKDFGAQLDDLPSDSADSGEATSDSDNSAGTSRSNKAKGKKPAAPRGKGKGQRKRGEEIVLTVQDLADAEDTFDLFFVDSAQEGIKRGQKTIGLAELQRACRVLKEKMGEGDLNEMLEYAGKSKGKVDLEAFARILAETGL